MDQLTRRAQLQEALDWFNSTRLMVEKTRTGGSVASYDLKIKITENLRSTIASLDKWLDTPRATTTGGSSREGIIKTGKEILLW